MSRCVCARCAAVRCDLLRQFAVVCVFAYCGLCMAQCAHPVGALAATGPAENACPPTPPPYALPAIYVGYAGGYAATGCC